MSGLDGTTFLPSLIYFLRMLRVKFVRDIPDQLQLTIRSAVEEFYNCITLSTMGTPGTHTVSMI